MAPPNATLTIRQQIVNALFEKLEALSRYDDPSSLVFNSVGRFELGDISYHQLPAVSLYEGEEATDDNTNQWITKILRVFIEFRFAHQTGLDVYDEYNYYLGELLYGLMQQRKLGVAPHYLNYDIQERGNSPRIADRNDDQPGGVLILDVYYRIGNYNPYSKSPNT